MDGRPRPGQDAPRSAEIALDELRDGFALGLVCSLVDENHRLAVPLVDGARPLDGDAEVQVVDF